MTPSTQPPTATTSGTTTANKTTKNANSPYDTRGGYQWR
jgi:hypothetical protein